MGSLISYEEGTPQPYKKKTRNNNIAIGLLGISLPIHGMGIAVGMQSQVLVVSLQVHIST